MMAGIALVAAKIDGAADEDRQIGVDLDQALILALIIIIAAPALAGDKFHFEIFALRQVEILRGACLALGNGGVEHHLQPVPGDDVVLFEHRHPLAERAAAGDDILDLLQHRIKFFQRLQFRRHPEQAEGFLGKGEGLALDHRMAGHRGFKLRGQEALARLDQRIVAGRQRVEPLHQRDNSIAQFAHVAWIRFRRFCPFGRPVIGIDIAGFLLTKRERQLHIISGDRAQLIRCSRKGRIGDHRRRPRFGDGRTGRHRQTGCNNWSGAFHRASFSLSDSLSGNA